MQGLAPQLGIPGKLQKQARKNNAQPKAQKCQKNVKSGAIPFNRATNKIAKDIHRDSLR
jgi:hypothetical protein